jgi:hypothetical protein
MAVSPLEMRNAVAAAIVVATAETMVVATSVE